MTTQQREVTRMKREEGTTEIMTKAKLKDEMKGNEEQNNSSNPSEIILQQAPAV